MSELERAMVLLIQLASPAIKPAQEKAILAELADLQTILELRNEAGGDATAIAQRRVVALNARSQREEA